ncbi:MAG: hypothetical protein CVT64_08640 [Actinobacteria bacterium HGW-Actinobacteria-4]|nr:MAG: hypothetical protein CVT64_08640 [Actinobacteria bacterium HGW-Actinobacteria-4]
MDNTEPLNIPGARGKIAVTGVHGIFYKILVDGQVIKPVKGKWRIPARNGSFKLMHARGVLPGFQRLFVEGEQVFDMAHDVSLAQRIVMFVPLTLIFVNPLLGFPLALILFFMNVTLVKNAAMPGPLRIALPIINTAAAALVVFLLTSGS